MKKNFNIGFVTVLLLTNTIVCIGQTTNKNYVEAIIPRTPVNTITDIDALPYTEKSDNINYSDGLGRPIQSVLVGASPNGGAIIKFQQYNALSQVQREYLPYSNNQSITNQKNFDDSYISNEINYYQNGTNVIHTDFPYREYVFDHSPLNKAVETGLYGKSWQLADNKTAKFNYRTNSNSEVYKWSKNSSGDFVATSFYPENELLVYKTYDQNNNWVEEFKDKENRTILIKKSLIDYIPPDDPSSGGSPIPVNHITYFIYDDFNNQIAIITPLAYYKMKLAAMNTATIAAQDLIFTFKYDSRKRLIEKNEPSKDAEYYVYDSKDRVILYQDGNLRAINQWQFTKYDINDNKVLEGNYPSSLGRNNLQSNANTFYNDPNNLNYEIYNSGAYTDQAFPTLTGTSYEIYTSNVYGQYDINGNSIIDADEIFVTDAAFPESNVSHIPNLLSYSKLRILDPTGDISPNSFVEIYYFYNEYYKNIQTKRIHHDKTYEYVRTSYTYSGEVEKLKKSYINLTIPRPTLDFNYRFEYDHAGRLQNSYLKMNSDDEIQISNKVYNEVGQLIQNNIERTAAESYLQTIDYKYNENGWLTHINDCDLYKPIETNYTNDEHKVERLANPDAVITGIAQYFKIKHDLLYSNFCDSITKYDTLISTIYPQLLYPERKFIIQYLIDYTNTHANDNSSIYNTFSRLLYILNSPEQDYTQLLYTSYSNYGSTDFQLILSNSENKYNDLLSGLNTLYGEIQNPTQPLTEQVGYLLEISRDLEESIYHLQSYRDSFIGDSLLHFYINYITDQQIHSIRGAWLQSERTPSLSSVLNEFLDKNTQISEADIRKMKNTLLEGSEYKNELYYWLASELSSTTQYADLSTQYFTYYQNFTTKKALLTERLHTSADAQILHNSASILQTQLEALDDIQNTIFNTLIQNIDENTSYYIPLQAIAIWDNTSSLADFNYPSPQTNISNIDYDKFQELKYITFNSVNILDGNGPILASSLANAAFDPLLGEVRALSATLLNTAAENDGNGLGTINDLRDLIRTSLDWGKLEGIGDRIILYLAQSTNNGSTEPDIFGMQLFYDKPFAELEAGANYNGNISCQCWKTQPEKKRRAYGYVYDEMNRLTKAHYEQYITSLVKDPLYSGNYDEKNIVYDLNGNITSLKRYGLDHTDLSKRVIDQLNYAYIGNRLKSIEDVSLYSYADFNDGVHTGIEYTYDANGNELSNLNKGVTVSYNALNLPSTVSKGGNTIYFVFDAAGTLLRKKLVPTSGSSEKVDYIGDARYRNNQFEDASIPDGHILADDRPGSTRHWYYEYYMKDHLGNTRMTYCDKDMDGHIDFNTEIDQETHYYPYGMKMGMISFDAMSPHNDYLYNGNELIGDFGWNLYNYGARYYDAQVGRWNSVDPLAEKYPSISSYVYVADNPVIFVDPDGRLIQFYNEKGQKIGNRDDGNKYETPVIISNSNIEKYLSIYKDMNVSITQLQSLGTTYDVKSISEFYNKSETKKVEYVGNESINSILAGYKSIEQNGKEISPNDLHPEVGGVLILNNGVITPSTGEVNCINNMVSCNPDMAKNTTDDQTAQNFAGYIHTHPDGFKVYYKSGNIRYFDLLSDEPSGGAGDRTFAKNRRDVVVSKRFIIIYGANKEQDIKIKRYGH